MGKRTALAVAAALVIVCPLARAFVLTTGAEFSFYRFEFAADSIAMGCLLANLTARRIPGTNANVRTDTKLLLLIPGIVLFTTLFSNRPSVIATPVYAGIVMPLQNVLIAAFIFRLLQWHDRQHVVSKILNWRPLVQIGVMSYSIYLWQQPFFSPHTDGWYATFPLNLLLAACCATVSYCLLERTSLRMRAQLERRIFKERPVPVQVQSLP